MAELQELAAWAADLVAAQAQEPRGWTQAARSTPQQALVARRSDLVDFGLWTAWQEWPSQPRNVRALREADYEDEKAPTA